LLLQAFSVVPSHYNTAERIGIQQINEAYEGLRKSDVKYRFVIDMASLR